MNWITLRKSNIHLVDRQVQRVIALYNQTRESIMQGDILSVQKMSQLQLSIKKRIQQMEDFYNQNCLDWRVRYLQEARMKLCRLINSSIITGKDEDLTINIIGKMKKEGLTQNRNQKKSITPKKVEILKDPTSKNLFRNQINKSPISKPKIQQLNKSSISSKKPNITLEIPNQVPQSHVTLSAASAKTEQSKPINQTKTGRKTQILPKNNSSYKQNNNLAVTTQPDKLQQQSNNYKIKIKQPIPSSSHISSSRSKVTNISSRNRALTQSNNMSSMKKLNDLIFTIKMTKQQYQDFMQIKKNLDYQARQV